MFRSSSFLLFAAGRLIMLAIYLGVPVAACQICLPFPTKSLADRILSSTHLVLARENPDQPFTLLTTRTLVAGDPDPPVLELFLDSSTRRRLSLDRDQAILCSWSPESGEWRRLGVYDADLALIVDDVLERRRDWESDPKLRVRYFANYLGHEKTVLSDLAHLEVARAPYRQVIQFSGQLSPGELRKRLLNLRRVEWHSLYILLLSQSERASDHEFIRGQLENHARYSINLQTAAWATALIEIDGRDGIKKLTQAYLDKPGRTPKEYAAIRAALRVHGDEGVPDLLDPIVAAYGLLLRLDPTLAPELVEDLARWGRFDYTDMLVDYLKREDLDLAAIARIRKYLQSAEESGAADNLPATDESDRSSATLVLAGIVILIPVLGALRGRQKQAAS